MENKLLDSFQKTAKWMFVVGLVMSIFNVFFWGIIIAFIEEFTRDAERLIPGVICLLISTYAGMISVKTAMYIGQYTKDQKKATLQLAFEYEAKFWNCLLGMVLGGVGTFLIIILFNA